MFEDNNGLEKIFSVEAVHHIEYTIYADIAHREARYEVERVFRAAALAELIHAKRQKTISKKMSNTDQNIVKAIVNEEFEIYELYPELIDKATSNKDFNALTSLEDAKKSDIRLVSLLIEQQSQVHETSHIYFVCNLCGFIAIDKMPVTCPVCQDESTIWHEIH